MARLPKAFESFRTRYRKVSGAYEALGGAVHESGPLDQKTRELVKLGIAIGGRLEGAVRSHASRALQAGATRQEIEHAILLALTTVGLPTTVAAFTWVHDLLARSSAKRRRAR